VAVVPVGLTRHRKGLPGLVPVDPGKARITLQDVGRLQRRYGKKLGEPFVYLADEFYLLAGKPVPRAVHYREFWQKDNGVGMVRAFLEEFKESRGRFPKSLPEKNRFVLATGVLAGPILERRVVPHLNRIRNVRAEVRVVPNRFFGESITVSGLLIAGDIARAVEKDQGDFTLLVPANALNAEGRFLDDATAESLGRRIRRPVRVLESFETFQESR
jgi:NifB/MoaA-like Fe-S oxidoreductase